MIPKEDLTGGEGNLSDVRYNPIDNDFIPLHLVYSPHEYGPTVWPQEWFNDSTFLTTCLLFGMTTFGLFIKKKSASFNW